MRVCLMLPATTANVDPLVAAIGHQPGSHDVSAVWGGAPHARPGLVGVDWLDAELGSALDISWGIALLALPPAAYEWARAAAAIVANDDRQPALVLRAGSVLVTGDLNDVSPEGLDLARMAVATRSQGPFPLDGLVPSAVDAERAGDYSTACAILTSHSARILLEEMAVCTTDDDVGPALGRAARRLQVATMPASAVTIAGWALGSSGQAVLVDVSDVSGGPGRPVLFDHRPARWKLSSDLALAELVEKHWHQRACESGGLVLPDGIVVDDVIRRLVADAVQRWRRGETPLLPDPCQVGGSFVEWLHEVWPPWGPDIPRYWMGLYHARTDLQIAFPRPGAEDADRFRDWTATRRRFEPDAPALAPATRSLRPIWSDAGRAVGGVNVIGYLGFDKSLGDVARRVLASLSAGQIPAAALDYYRSGSPRTASPPDLCTELRYDTNLLIINADQQANLAADYGSILRAGRRTVAYWFWEVDSVPAEMRRAFEHVDAVMVATEFTAAALRAATDKPVFTVPVPVPAPQPSTKARSDFGLPDDRFMFLVTLDHLSVTERKNPMAAVHAFRSAFPEADPDGPVLVVKTINAAHRPAQHDWIHQAAGGRQDVIIIDRHLSRADQMALVAASDCMVSLHRAEGLGLHLMEAMWFAKPTIATRYSGNLAFMDDGNSALVDATLVSVDDHEGYYPTDTTWAEPDLVQAAAWMRRIVAEPQLRRTLGAAGLATMEQQPTLAGTGEAIMSLLQRVPIRSDEPTAELAPHEAVTGRTSTMSIKQRLGWLLRSGANERAALDDHAAAIQAIQRSVAELTESVARLDGRMPVPPTHRPDNVDDIEQRLAMLSDVVAAMTIRNDRTHPPAGGQADSSGIGA